MSIECSATPLATEDSPPFNVALFGRRCTLTAVPLRSLVSSDVTVRAVVVPAQHAFGPPVRIGRTRATMPLVEKRKPVDMDSVDEIAARNRIPVAVVRRPLSGELAALIEEFSIDLIVISCFPWRVPRAVCQRAAFGAINLHPSPLPQFRGPDPLFWAFQTATRKWGVSVHRASERFDAGPILGQQSLEIPDGASGSDLERLCAEAGSNVLLNVLDQIRSNSARERAQDESTATYLGFPDTEDLFVRPRWTVRRALNFVAGISSLGYTPLVMTNRGTAEVRGAKAVDEKQFIASEYWVRADLVRLSLLDGSAEFTVAGTGS